MSEPLTRRVISAAVTPLGWRLVLSQLDTAVPVGSLAEGAEVASRVAARLGADARDRLRIDVRADAVAFTVPAYPGEVTEGDLALVAAISDAVRVCGH